MGIKLSLKEMCIHQENKESLNIKVKQFYNQSRIHHILTTKEQVKIKENLRISCEALTLLLWRHLIIRYTGTTVMICPIIYIYIYFIFQHALKLIAHKP